MKLMTKKRRKTRDYMIICILKRHGMKTILQSERMNLEIRKFRHDIKTCLCGMLCQMHDKGEKVPFSLYVLNTISHGGSMINRDKFPKGKLIKAIMRNLTRSKKKSRFWFKASKV